MGTNFNNSSLGQKSKAFDGFDVLSILGREE